MRSEAFGTGSSDDKGTGDIIVKSNSNEDVSIKPSTEEVPNSFLQSHSEAPTFPQSTEKVKPTKQRSTRDSKKSKGIIRSHTSRKYSQVKLEMLEEAGKALESCKTDLEAKAMIDVIPKEKNGVKVTDEELEQKWEQIKLLRTNRKRKRPWEVDPEPFKGEFDVEKFILSVEQIIQRTTVLQKLPEIPFAFSYVGALWAACTWIPESFNISTYLLVTGPAEGSGKSVFVRVLSKLSYHPFLTNDVTPAFMYRGGEELGLTFFLDEGHHYIPVRDMSGLLDGGTHNDCFVGRSDLHSNKSITNNSFGSFGFKVISGIAMENCLTSELVSRCIKIPMQRRKPGEEVLRFDYLPESIFEEVQSKMARVREESQDWVKQHRPMIPKELYNRYADKWIPLFSFADWLDHKLGQRSSSIGIPHGECIRRIAVILESRPETGSTGVELLEDVKYICEMDKYANSPYILSADFVKELTSNMELPNGNFYGLKCHPRQIAKILRGFGIEPKLIPAENNRRGYFKADFEDSFERYLKDPVFSSGQYTLPEKLLELEIKSLDWFEKQSAADSPVITLLEPKKEGNNPDKD